MSFDHCGDAEFLRTALTRPLPEAERTQFEAHLETCQRCQHTIEQLAAGDIDPDDLARSLRSPREADSALLDAMPRMHDAVETTGESPASADATSLDFLDPSDDEGALGRLGPYEIYDVVGRGGMGVVLRGFDRKLDRVVAIKVLAPELAANATARRRFLREAKAAAAVSHPQVVTIFAVEDSQRLPFLVMEYVDGQSLEAKIEREGQLELKEILRVGMQTAAGLAAAHAQGLIHRDIKPGNILLENGVERVRITDFGLARAVDDVGVTRTGEAPGTPMYMSPEQAGGGRVDQRSDLFSLGCVLYAMCTGRSPFRAESAIAVIRRVCDDTPRPIREVNSDIPAWLTSVIDRLLAKRPEDRIQTAGEVSDLLGRHLAHLHDPESSPPPSHAQARRKRPLLHRWLFAACVLLAVLGGLGLTEATGVTHVAEFMETVLRIRTPHGTLVLEIDEPGMQVAIEGNGEKLTISGAGIEKLELSPGKYKVRATKNGESIREELVTITRNDRKLVRVTLETAAAANRAPPTAAEDVGIREIRRFEGHTGPVKQVAFSPDGTLALSACGYPRGDRTVGLWDVARGKEIRTLATSNMQFMTVCFSPDGDRAAASGFGGVVHVWEVATGTEIMSFETNTEVVDDLEFSPGGRQLLCAAHKRRFPSPRKISDLGTAGLWDSQTGEMLWRVDSEGWFLTGAFLADGQIAVAGSQTEAQVHLLDRDTGHELRRLEFIGGEILSIEELAVSRDGRWIAGASDDGYLCLWDAKAGGKPIKYRPNMADLHTVAFSPDGRRVLCGGGEGVAGSIQLLDIPSLNPIASADHPSGMVWHVAYSPDGRLALSAGGWVDEQFQGDFELRLWRLPESVSPKESAALVEPGAFVVLGPGDEERKIDTLAEAVDASSPGGTIEIRGNAPFVIDPIEIDHALTIRASDGFRPVLRCDPGKLPDHRNWIISHQPLVLEGLAFDLVAQKPVPASDDLSGQILSPRAPLDAVNCRFHSSGRCIFIPGGADCRLRNCELLCSGGFGRVAVNIDETRAGQRVVVDNCVLFPVGIRTGLMGAGDADIQLLRNTFGSLEGGALTLDLRPTVQRGELEGKVLRVQASANIYGNDCVLLVGAPDEDVLAPDDTVRHLKRLLRWNGGANLFAVDGPFVWMNMNGRGKLHPGKPVRNLADWRDFLGVEESDSLAGSVEYQGGDLLARLRENPEQLTPDDFRLRPDSAGYRAGPGGKDLGADIDLVGPGEAYERWKQTPGYQQWLKETQSLMADAAELDAALGLFDQQLREGQWLAAAETFGTLLKQRDPAILAAPGSGYALVRYAIVLVHLGELDRYRRLCAELVEAYGTTEDVYIASNVCRTCLILPGVVDASLLPVAPLDARLQTAAGMEDPWIVEARALIAHRSGHYEEAINWAGERLKRDTEAPRTLPRGLAVMAMAQHKSGAREQARKTFEQARQLFQQASEGNPNEGVLYTEMLLREAAEVLGVEGDDRQSSVERCAFVVLGDEDGDRRFDTLAEAVKNSTAGGTIEIRGDGPFETAPIEITRALTIRAGEGFRPVISNKPWGEQEPRPLLHTESALVLEGLEVVNQWAFESESERSGGWDETLLCEGPSLHVFNCRFVKKWASPVGEAFVGPCLTSRAPENAVRNCDVIVPNGYSLKWALRPGDRLAVENCTFTGPIALYPQRFGDAPSVVHIHRCTILPRAVVFPRIQLAEREEGASRINIRATNSVFDPSQGVIGVATLDPTLAEARLSNVVAWRDEHNAYGARDGMLMSGPPWTAVLKYDKHLTNWKRFWTEPDAEALGGPVRFAGGYLRARRAEPQRVTPEDFRLRPDSVGFRAGPDGEDLGAEIDLVGPGMAYERWKRTSDCRQWRAETQTLMSDAEELADRVRLFEQQLQESRWREAATTFGALLKARGQEIVKDDPSLAWNVRRYGIALVYLNELDRYRQCCAKLLDACANTEHVEIADDVCETCLILPDVVEVSSLPLRPIEDYLKTATGREDARIVGIRALIAYRARDYDDAAERAAEYLELLPADAHPGLLARGLAIVAMAQHRSGAHEEARITYAEAQEVFQRLKNVPLSGGVIFTGILMHEAAEVLGLPEKADASPVVKGSEDNQRRSNRVESNLLRPGAKSTSPADAGSSQEPQGKKQ